MERNKGYIEQVISGNSFLKYLPFTLGFFGFFLFNFYVSIQNKQSTQDVIKQSIELIGKPMTFVVTVLPLSMLFFALIFWVKIFHKQTITSLVTSRQKIDYSRVFFGFGIWGIINVLLIAANYLLFPNDFELVFDAEQFVVFFILSVLLLPLQTSFEELFFRGYLMQGIGIFAKNRWVPLLLTSILFGMVHMLNPEVTSYGLGIMFFYIGTGLLLGMITLLDEGTELALGFHAANNLIVSLILTSESSALQTSAILKDVSANESMISTTLLQIGILYPVLLFVFYRKYKWKNWKQKLMYLQR